MAVCNVVVQASEDSLDTTPIDRFLVSRLAQKSTCILQSLHIHTADALFYPLRQVFRSNSESIQNEIIDAPSAAGPSGGS